MLYSDELYHHGIKGQKWGVRRYQNKDGSLTAAGREHRNSYASSKDEAGPVAVLWLATAAALMIGSAAIANNNKQAAAKSAEEERRKRIQEYREQYKKIEDKVAKFDKERAESPIDKKTGYHKKTREMTPEEDLERVNPEYMLDARFGSMMHSGVTSNCALCSLTYDMRRRGYEVTAGTTADGMSRAEQASMYKTKSGKPASFKTVNSQATNGKAVRESIEHDILQDGPESRGILCVRWKMGGGHSMAYEVHEGKFRILDGQTNTVHGSPEQQEQFLNYVSTKGLQYMRTDNLEPNIENMKGHVL